MFTYKTNGTCSTEIHLEIKEGVITQCEFVRGCRGNTAGLARMVIGRNAEEVANLLEGVPCRPATLTMPATSCPDQLSKAIRAYHE